MNESFKNCKMFSSSFAYLLCLAQLTPRVIHIYRSLSSFVSYGCDVILLFAQSNLVCQKYIRTHTDRCQQCAFLCCVDSLWYFFDKFWFHQLPGMFCPSLSILTRAISEALPFPVTVVIGLMPFKLATSTTISFNPCECFVFLKMYNGRDNLKLPTFRRSQSKLLFDLFARFLTFFFCQTDSFELLNF